MNLITEIAHHLPLTILSLLVLALLFTTQVNAVDEPKTLLLWADGAPETKGDKPQDKPEIIVYLPAP
jgi:hypothetical protein